MDSAQIEDEALDQQAEVASDTSVEEDDALEGPEERVRPVFFDMPILRLAKFIVCASIFAVMLNPPAALLGADPKRSSEVHVSPVRWEASRPVSEAESVISVLAAEAGDGVEAAAEAIAEKVSSIIAPKRGALVRSELPAEPIVRSEQPEDVENSRRVLWQGIKNAVGNSRGQMKQKLPEDTWEEPSVGTAMSKLAQNDEIHKVETDTVDLAWRDLNTLPHVIIAAILIVGFIVNLRSRVAGILQSLPGYISKSRA